MFKISESAIIERSPTEVFEIAANPNTQRKWDSANLQEVEKTMMKNRMRVVVSEIKAYLVK